MIDFFNDDDSLDDLIYGHCSNCNGELWTIEECESGLCTDCELELHP